MAHSDDRGKHPRNEASSSRPPNHPPPPLDANDAERSLGECGEEVSVWLSFMIDGHIYQFLADLPTSALDSPIPPPPPSPTMVAPAVVMVEEMQELLLMREEELT
jgi:hypothetical protein